MSSAEPHTPIMVDEVVHLLGDRRVVVDATVGAGGHAEALLSAGVDRVIGIDRDPGALAEASRRLRRFGDRFRPARGRFSELADTLADQAVEAAGGVLYDLGVSSMQLDRAER